MIKETISFEDTDGKQITMDAYFHASSRDLLNIGLDSGIKSDIEQLSDLDYIKRVTTDGTEEEQTEYTRQLLNIIDEIVKISYGERVESTLPNGETYSSFKKNPAKTELFMDSDAYGAFVLDLVSNGERFSKFINGVFPESMIRSITNRVSE